MNQFKLEGTLTKDPYFKDGGSWTMAKVTILPAGQEKGAIEVTLWGELAAAVKDAKKGATVAVQGSLRNRKRDDLTHAKADYANKPVWVTDLNADSKENGTVTVDGVEAGLPF